MRRFFISPEQLNQPRPCIDGSDARHIRVVLRLQPGDAIDVLDGRGGGYRARIAAIEHGRVYLQLENPLSKQTESNVELTLAQGILKDKKMDGLVRQLTELGVSRWVPFVARRSVPVPDDRRMASRYERWQKISQEAVKQCGRRRPMTIDSVLTFENALEQARTCDLKLIFWEKHGDLEKQPPSRPPSPASIFIMIGPEGGFEPDEVALARHAGFHVAGMGPRILKAETATIAAAVMTQFVFGDMGQNFLDNPRAV